MNRFIVYLSLFSALFAFPAHAQANIFSKPPQTPPALLNLDNQQTILPHEQAFIFSAEVAQPNVVNLDWTITSGYYLYENQFQVLLYNSEPAVITDIHFPASKTLFDSLIGEYQAYEGQLIVPVTLDPHGAHAVTLHVRYQGCSSTGFCYPPVVQAVKLDLSNIGSKGKTEEIFEQAFTIPSTTPPAETNTNAETVVSEQDAITGLLNNQSMGWALLAFFGFGLLLTFTPCVLPMVPILSSIIVGQKNITTARAFRLSLVYVLFMAFTYAVAGIFAGLAGTTVQAYLQSPAVIIGFSIIFVALALSMFGFYEIRLPHRVHQHLLQLNQKQRGGTYISVAIMGVLSAIVVSPCVTAPLVGALAYISTTGDATLGGLALFSLAMGMGVPLLIIGTFEGRLLPKSGEWMNTVKHIFGVLLLALAIWTLERIIPGPVILLLWAALLIVTAVYMGLFESVQKTTLIKAGVAPLWKGLGLMMVIYAIILIIGASLGNNNPLQPLAGLNFSRPGSGENATLARQPTFTVIKSFDDFERAVFSANAAGKPVLLDFYADWCVSCIRMERHTFTDADVQALLSNIVLLKADVTAYDAIDRALMRKFDVYAPPAILFFDKEGREHRQYRLVGEMGPEKFYHHASRALGY